MTQTGPFLGVLMLDTAFARIPGDAGNPDSYPFPVRVARVVGVGVGDVVGASRPSAGTIRRFEDAARAIEAEGAVGIVSTCGFLAHIQAEIARAVTVPALMSALSLFPALKQSAGSRRIGVLTASKRDLSNGTLDDAGIAEDDVCVAGFEDCAAFSQAILGHRSDRPGAFDAHAIEACAVARARALLRRDPDLGCILLECGNLPPYAPAIRAAARRPVFSILDAARMLWSAAQPGTLPGRKPHERP